MAEQVHYATSCMLPGRHDCIDLGMTGLAADISAQIPSLSTPKPLLPAWTDLLRVADAVASQKPLTFSAAYYCYYDSAATW
jgi:hypothetical protein